jgi:hypothetical protein
MLVFRDRAVTKLMATNTDRIVRLSGAGTTREGVGYPLSMYRWTIE